MLGGSFAQMSPELVRGIDQGSEIDVRRIDPWSAPTSESGTASPSNTPGGFVLWELRSSGSSADVGLGVTEPAVPK